MTNYTINHINQTITLTKNFAKAAGTAGTNAYKEMVKLRKDWPGYEMLIREIKRNANKRSYGKLTYKRMREYLIDWEGNDAPAIGEYDRVCQLAKIQSNPYQYVKNWFLKRYKDTLNELEEADSTNTENENV